MDIVDRAFRAIRANGKTFSPTDIKSILGELADRGRGSDNLIAHINPREAALLKRAGGSGRINPRTGLLEFDDTNEGGGGSGGGGGAGYGDSDSFDSGSFAGAVAANNEAMSSAINDALNASGGGYGDPENEGGAGGIGGGGGTGSGGGAGYGGDPEAGGGAGYGGAPEAGISVGAPAAEPEEPPSVDPYSFAATSFGSLSPNAPGIGYAAPTSLEQYTQQNASREAFPSVLGVPAVDPMIAEDAKAAALAEQAVQARELEDKALGLSGASPMVDPAAAAPPPSQSYPTDEEFEQNRAAAIAARDSADKTIASALNAIERSAAVSNAPLFSEDIQPASRGIGGAGRGVSNQDFSLPAPEPPGPLDPALIAAPRDQSPLNQQIIEALEREQAEKLGVAFNATPIANQSANFSAPTMSLNTAMNLPESKESMQPPGTQFAYPSGGWTPSLASTFSFQSMEPLSPNVPLPPSRPDDLPAIQPANPSPSASLFPLSTGTPTGQAPAGFAPGSAIPSFSSAIPNFIQLAPEEPPAPVTRSTAPVAPSPTPAAPLPAPNPALIAPVSAPMPQPANVPLPPSRPAEFSPTPAAPVAPSPQPAAPPSAPMPQPANVPLPPSRPAEFSPKKDDEFERDIYGNLIPRKPEGMARGGYADGGTIYDPMGNVTMPPEEGFAPSPIYDKAMDAIAKSGAAVGSPVTRALQTAADVYSDKSREAAAENEALRQQAMRNMQGELGYAGMPLGAGQMLLSQLGTATLPLTAAAKTAGYAATQATGNPRFGENVEVLSGFVDPSHVGMLKAAAPMAGAAAARQAVQTARELSPLGLYSHGAEAALAMPQAKGSPEQMVAQLRSAGVRPAELFSTGIADEAATNALRTKIESEMSPRIAQAEEALKSLTPGTKEFKDAERQLNNLKGTMRSEMDRALVIAPDWASRPSVTREEIAQHLHEQMPVVEERVLGGKSTVEFTPEMERRLDDLTDKRISTGLTEEEMAEKNRLFRLQEEARTGRSATKFNQYTLPGGENYREIALTIPGEEKHRVPEAHRMGEGADVNRVAHIRMSDRTGPNGEKILHVEELQSDWGQTGRKYGFAPKKELSTEQEKRMQQLAARATRLNPNEQEELRRLFTTGMEVPPAPYVTSTEGWTDLALKRVLKEAAEGGYDRVVFTPGAEQAKRYDLSYHVERVAYDPEKKILSFVRRGQRPWQNYERSVEPGQLAGIIGKDAAEKLLSTEPSWRPPPRVSGDWSLHHTLETEGLTFGGEGMKAYYDKMVPKRLQELVRRHDKGAKVGYIEGALPEGIAAPGITITPQMRESILRGQPHMAEGGVVDGSENFVQRALERATQLGYRTGGSVSHQAMMIAKDSARRPAAL